MTTMCHQQPSRGTFHFFCTVRVCVSVTHSVVPAQRRVRQKVSGGSAVFLQPLQWPAGGVCRAAKGWLENFTFPRPVMVVTDMWGLNDDPSSYAIPIRPFFVLAKIRSIA